MTKHIVVTDNIEGERGTIKLHHEKRIESHLREVEMIINNKRLRNSGEP